MIRTAYLAILDFRFPIVDCAFHVQNPISRSALSFTLHTLLVLACALQMQVFAEDNSGQITISSPSANLKSSALGGSASGGKIPARNATHPPATEILAQARANLPREPLLIKGQILSGGRLGKLERVCYIEMLLDFGGEPAIIRYKISDLFGTPLEQMTVCMTEGGETEYEYEAGQPLKPAAAPPPTGAIRNTDITWNDLSLLFLWRLDGRTVRIETLRGRDCYVLEFPIHEDRIACFWIDTQMLVLIQAEEIDGIGRLQRRMTVKNIKKISDQWMIKNLEMRSFPSLHHTLIKVDEVAGQVETGE